MWKNPLPRIRSRIRQSPAWWQSGYAADCKSAYAGSIPTQASNSNRGLSSSPRSAKKTLLRNCAERGFSFGRRSRNRNRGIPNTAEPSSVARIACGDPLAWLCGDQGPRTTKRRLVDWTSVRNRVARVAYSRSCSSRLMPRATEAACQASKTGAREHRVCLTGSIATDTQRRRLLLVALIIDCRCCIPVGSDRDAAPPINSRPPVLLV